MLLLAYHLLAISEMFSFGIFNQIWKLAVCLSYANIQKLLDFYVHILNSPRLLKKAGKLYQC